MIRTMPIPRPHPALTRLNALLPLGAPATAALHAAIGQAQPVRIRQELLAEGAEISGPRLLVTGWAARVRLLADGRRQFLSFILPGDLIGQCRQTRPLATSSIVALTEVLVCPAPSPADLPALGEAYALSHALDEAYLLAQVTRLGRLTAQERIIDLLLELHERLSLAGLTRANGFELPLTQEMMGDALGLTSVHINRMVQLARRNGEISWKGGRLTLAEPDMLSRMIGRAPVRVSAEQRLPQSGHRAA